jgi:hypothetical protein
MRRVGGLLREPLVQFLLIGAALFLLFGLVRAPGGKAQNRIVVDANQVDQLRAQFTRTWLRAPTQEELTGLVREHVREEVYYREALAMGLDRGDAMVRRRMRQKLEFLLEDLSAEAPPSDEVLAAFMQREPERFRKEPQAAFRQVYLNPEKHPDLLADATAVLASLKRGAAAEALGDVTMLPFESPLAPRSEIARLFGESFAEKVVTLPEGPWAGPIPSALGAHLVLVTKRIDARMPGLAEIRPVVEREYLVQRRLELKDLAYRKLLEGYEVVVEAGPKNAGADAGARVSERNGRSGR